MDKSRVVVFWYHQTYMLILSNFTSFKIVSTVSLFSYVFWFDIGYVTKIR